MDKCRIRHLQCEDKRKVLFMILQEACDEFPDYSSGDILYTILRSIAKDNGQSVAFLRSLTNDELYSESEFRLWDELNR